MFLIRSFFYTGFICLIAQMIKDNTKLIVCAHASNVCGAVMPIKMISELCKEYGIKLLIDAAQWRVYCR